MKHFYTALFSLGNRSFCGYSVITPVPPIDPDTLPKDIDLLQKLVVELCERLQHESSEKNKYRSLLRELLDDQRNRKSGQLSKEQLALFETLWKAGDPEPDQEQAEDAKPDANQSQDNAEEPPEAPNKRSGRQPLARNVIRERIVHDLAEAEKHCNCCGKDLRLVYDPADKVPTSPGPNDQVASTTVL